MRIRNTRSNIAYPQRSVDTRLDLDRSGEGVPSEPGGRGGHHVRERGLQLALRVRPNTTACPN
jgi:hypothetical protein